MNLSIDGSLLISNPFFVQARQRYGACAAAELLRVLGQFGSSWQGIWMNPLTFWIDHRACSAFTAPEGSSRSSAAQKVIQHFKKTFPPGMHCSYRLTASKRGDVAIILDPESPNPPLPSRIRELRCSHSSVERRLAESADVSTREIRRRPGPARPDIDSRLQMDQETTVNWFEANYGLRATNDLVRFLNACGASVRLLSLDHLTVEIDVNPEGNDVTMGMVCRARDIQHRFTEQFKDDPDLLWHAQTINERVLIGFLSFAPSGGDCQELRRRMDALGSEPSSKSSSLKASRERSSGRSWILGPRPSEGHGERVGRIDLVRPVALPELKKFPSLVRCGELYGVGAATELLKFFQLSEHSWFATSMNPVAFQIVCTPASRRTPQELMNEFQERFGQGIIFSYEILELNGDVLLCLDSKESFPALASLRDAPVLRPASVPELLSGDDESLSSSESASDQPAHSAVGQEPGDQVLSHDSKPSESESVESVFVDSETWSQLGDSSRPTRSPQFL